MEPIWGLSLSRSCTNNWEGPLREQNRTWLSSYQDDLFHKGNEIRYLPAESILTIAQQLHHNLVYLIDSTLGGPLRYDKYDIGIL